MALRRLVKKINPFMVTSGGQSVPYIPEEREGTWQATARHTQRHEEAGAQYRVQQLSDGFWHIVDAKTGKSTGKYGMTAERAQQLLGKMLRRTNPKRRFVETEWGGHQYMGGGEDDIGISVTHYVGKAPAKQLRGTAARYVGDPGIQKLRSGERVYEVTFYDKWDKRFLTELSTGRPAEVRRRAEKEHGKDLREIREVKPGQQMHEWANPLQISRNTERALTKAAAAAAGELTRAFVRRRNPSPVPGISVEEVIADIDGEEWANWAFNRAGIRHWNG